jgi:hypothetical protein
MLCWIKLEVQTLLIKNKIYQDYNKNFKLKINRIFQAFQLIKKLIKLGN